MGLLLRSTKKAGFTIPEVVVSLVLLALVWVAMAQVIIAGAISGSMARHKAQAIYVMMRTIENARASLRTSSFSSLANGTTTTTVSLDTKGTPDSSTDDFTGTQVVTISTPNASYKQMLVSISWREKFLGATRTTREYCGTLLGSDSQLN